MKRGALRPPDEVAIREDRFCDPMCILNFPEDNNTPMRCDKCGILRLKWLLPDSREGALYWFWPEGHIYAHGDATTIRRLLVNP